MALKIVITLDTPEPPRPPRPANGRALAKQEAAALKAAIARVQALHADVALVAVMLAEDHPNAPELLRFYFPALKREAD